MISGLDSNIPRHFVKGSMAKANETQIEEAIEAIIPEEVLRSRNTAMQMTTPRLPDPEQFLKLILFMASNNMLDSNAYLAKSLYEWLRRLSSTAVLELLLSTKSAAIEALIEKFFILAVKNQDLTVVDHILHHGFDISGMRLLSDGMLISPLQYACYFANVALVQALLKAGADVNFANYTAGPLVLAVETFYALGLFGSSPDSPGDDSSLLLELVQILLEAGADVNPGHGSPLWGAAYMGQLHLVDLLLRYGADPAFKDLIHGTTPLMELIRSNNTPDVVGVVRQLIEKGSDVNAISNIDGEERTALSYAIAAENVTLVTILLEAGAKLSEKILCEAVEVGSADIVELCLTGNALATSSAIEKACRQGNFDLVDLLLTRTQADERAAAEESALLGAIKGGHIERAKSIIAKGPDFWSREALTALATSSAIEEACRKGNFDLVDLLLNYTRVEKRAAAEELALLGAIKGGHIERVKSMIAKGLDVPPRKALTGAIEAAATRGYTGMLRFLLDGGCVLQRSALESLGCSLSCAVRNNHREITDLLLCAGADPNQCHNDEYDPPLLLAILQRDQFLSQQLMKAGATPNYTRYSSRLSVLPAAIQWGFRPLIRTLIDEGADLNAWWNPGYGVWKTALIIAIEKGDRETVLSLIDAGVDVNAVFNVEWAQKPDYTALVAAIQRKDLDLARRLLSLGAELTELAFESAVHTNPEFMRFTTKNARCTYRVKGFGSRALQLAVTSQNFDMIELLLACGVCPNFVTDLLEWKQDNKCYRSSSFGSAILRKWPGDATVVSTFLAAGADPNGIVCKYQSSFQTALLAAVDEGNLDVVEVLVENGARVNGDVLGRIRRTPLQQAPEAGALRIVKFLLSKEADVNAPPHKERGGTALQFAAIKGYLGIATLLLNAGADVNATGANIDGRTALEGAAELGRVDIVQLLLNAGARVIGAGARQYERARKMALENGHVAVACVLERHQARELESYPPCIRQDEWVEDAVGMQMDGWMSFDGGDW
jgi:ankyrin repeat protein